MKYLIYFTISLFLCLVALISILQVDLFDFEFMNKLNFDILLNLSGNYIRQAQYIPARSKDQNELIQKALLYSIKANQISPIDMRGYLQQEVIYDYYSTFLDCNGIDPKDCPKLKNIKQAIVYLNKSLLFIFPSSAWNKVIQERLASLNSAYEKHLQLHKKMKLSREDKNSFSLDDLKEMWSLNRKKIVLSVLGRSPWKMNLHFSEPIPYKKNYLDQIKVFFNGEDETITIQMLMEKGKQNTLKERVFFVNPDFEAGKNASGSVIGWPGNLYNNSKGSNSLILGYKGNKTNVINLDNSISHINTNSSAVSFRFPVFGGKDYFIGGKIFKERNSGSIHVAWFNSRGTNINYPAITSKISGKWDTIGTVLTAPCSAAYAEIWLINYQSLSNCAFDDILFFALN